MEEEKKKNKKTFYLTIGLCIVLVVAFIFLSSYAYWRLSDRQSGSNLVVGGCLEIEFEEPGVTGFTLEDAWPTEDTKGILQPGYSFNVINTCKKEVNYQVVLESIGVPDPSKKMKPEYIKLQLDNGAIIKYSELEEVDNDTDPHLDYEIYQTRQMLTGIVPAATDNEYGKVEHNVKIWLDIDAGLDARGQQFNSKVKVFAGQGVPEPEYAITPESCFEFDAETGKITDYYYANPECGLEALVVPATINGVIVKDISLKSTSYDSDAQNQNYGYVDLSKATGLENIGYDSFNGYVGTGKELIFPDSLKTISGSAFYKFAGDNVVLGKNISYIGNYAFRAYQGTNQPLTIPGNDTVIGTQAFRSYNGSLLTFEDGVKEIGDSAFDAYVGTGQDLYIPDSVTDFSALIRFNGNSIHLSHNSNMRGRFASYVGANQDLTIPGSYTGYGSFSFSNYTGENAQLTIEEGVQAIGQGLFSSYIGKDFVVPSTVVKLYTDAFSNFTGKITFNMTPAQFANVTKQNNWKNSAATIMCLENNTEVPCE